MISIALENPFAMLYAALDKSANMRALFQDRLAVHPCSLERPWSIIMYSDEVTPGNPLSAANRRKLQCIYWSFAELGFVALSHEECWFVLVVELSSTVSELSLTGVEQSVIVVQPLLKTVQPPTSWRRSNHELGSQDLQEIQNYDFK